MNAVTTRNILSSNVSAVKQRFTHSDYTILCAIEVHLLTYLLYSHTVRNSPVLYFLPTVIWSVIFWSCVFALSSTVSLLRD